MPGEKRSQKSAAQPDRAHTTKAAPAHGAGVPVERGPRPLGAGLFLERHASILAYRSAHSAAAARSGSVPFSTAPAHAADVRA